MYVKHLEVENFRSLPHAALDFRWPEAATGLDNTTLLLGDNGTGKSTLLQAIALGSLAPIIEASGFRPFHLVRHGQDTGSVTATLSVPGHDSLESQLQVRKKGSYESVSVDGIPALDGLYEDTGPGFLVLGYGATRRVDQSDVFDPSQMDKQRSRRYRRVASLFEPPSARSGSVGTAFIQPPSS